MVFSVEQLVECAKMRGLTGIAKTDHNTANGNGTYFDPTLIEIFIKVKDEFKNLTNSIETGMLNYAEANDIKIESRLIHSAYNEFNKEDKMAVELPEIKLKNLDSARETLINCLRGMKRKTHGVQESRHVEVTSTAQRSDSPAQGINQCFPRETNTGVRTTGESWELYLATVKRKVLVNRSFVPTGEKITDIKKLSPQQIEWLKNQA